MKISYQKAVEKFIIIIKYNYQIFNQLQNTDISENKPFLFLKIHKISRKSLYLPT